MSVKSNGGIKALLRDLDEAGKRIRRLAAREVEKSLAKAIDEGFATKTDPDDNAWQPPKDGGRTMERTGKLRRGFKVLATPVEGGLRVTVTNKQGYADWLQQGTTKMVPRKMTPEGDALPPRFKRAVEEAYKEAIRAWSR